MIDRVASHPAQRPGGDHPEEAVQVRGHAEPPVFVGDAQLIKQSPVMEEAGQGWGNLLTVVASSLYPAPKLNIESGRESEKEKYKG